MTWNGVCSVEEPRVYFSETCITSPVLMLMGAEGAEIIFEGLVGAFGECAGLRMLSRESLGFDLAMSEEVCLEFGDETEAMVRIDVLVNPMVTD